MHMWRHKKNSQVFGRAREGWRAALKGRKIMCVLQMLGYHAPPGLSSSKLFLSGASFRFFAQLEGIFPHRDACCR